MVGFDTLSAHVPTRRRAYSTLREMLLRRPAPRHRAVPVRHVSDGTRCDSSVTHDGVTAVCRAHDREVNR